MLSYGQTILIPKKAHWVAASWRRVGRIHENIFWKGTMGKVGQAPAQKPVPSLVAGMSSTTPRTKVHSMTNVSMNSRCWCILSCSSPGASYCWDYLACYVRPSVGPTAHSWATRSTGSILCERCFANASVCMVYRMKERGCFEDVRSLKDYFGTVVVCCCRSKISKAVTFQESSREKEKTLSCK